MKNFIFVTPIINFFRMNLAKKKQKQSHKKINQLKKLKEMIIIKPTGEKS